MTVARPRIRILSVDPGSERSALVGLEDPGTASMPFIVEKLLAPNAEILEAIAKLAHAFDVLAIERDKAYTMAMSDKRRFFPQQVLDTHVWLGRFEQQWRASLGTFDVRFVSRIEVRQHLCGTNLARDPQVRAALLELYGGAGA